MEELYDISTKLDEKKSTMADHDTEKTSDVEKKIEDEAKEDDTDWDGEIKKYQKEIEELKSLVDPTTPVVSNNTAVAATKPKPKKKKNTTKSSKKRKTEPLEDPMLAQRRMMYEDPGMPRRMMYEDPMIGRRWSTMAPPEDPLRWRYGEGRMPVGMGPPPGYYPPQYYR